jgi:outer membrane lipoprotein-sorting protein
MFSIPRDRMIVACVLTLMMIVSVGHAQQKNFRPVSDMATFRKQFVAESSKVQTISSDFKQQKQLLALTETITSTGKFWFKRPVQVRIDYLKPFVYQMIMSGDRMQVRDDQKATTFNTKSNKLFQQVNKIMVDCISGSILESSDFTSKVFENDLAYRIELTPVSKTLKGFFEVIIVLVDRKDYSVDSIEMNEPGGDTTTITFTNKLLNQPVGDEVFKF